jgi:outer membrane protein
VARREQGLIDAQSKLEAARLQLARLTNPGPAGRLENRFDPLSRPRIEPRAIGDISERLTLAERLRPDLAEARLRLEQRRLETIVTADGVLPRLDLFFGVGKTGFGSSFGQAFSNLDSRNYDVMAGLSFSHALGNRSGRARDFAARVSRRQAVAALDNLKQLIRLEVRLAVNETERARRQIEASAATRSMQQRALDAERERFEVGKSTGLLVSQAQRDLLASQIAEVEAVIAYRQALVSLYLAEGSLLARRGLHIGASSAESKEP